MVFTMFVLSKVFVMFKMFVMFKIFVMVPRYLFCRQDVCTHIVTPALYDGKLEGEPGVKERLTDVKHSPLKHFLKLIHLSGIRIKS